MNRLKNWWSDYSWPVLLVIGLAAMTLGYIGFNENAASVGAERTILDNLYLTLGLISMNSGAVEGPVSWQLQIARFLIPVVTAYTAFKAFTAIFIQQTDRIRLLFTRDHIVICGLGRKGFRLANQFIYQGRQVVVIEVDDGHDWIENIRSAGAIVIQGDATDPDLLLKVNLNRAKHLISVLGDDGKNAEVAIQAEKLSHARRTGVLTCIIHIYDAQLWYLLREKEFDNSHNEHFRLDLFNIFHDGAQLMFEENLPWKTGEEKQDVHLLVIGLGKMGQSLVVEAVQSWRRLKPRKLGKLSITIIDMAADQKLLSMMVQFPQLKTVAALNPLTMNIHSADFQQIEPHFQEDDRNMLDKVYICLDNESLSLHTALSLNQQLRTHQVPIVLRMVESGGLSQLLQEDKCGSGAFENLHVFDLLDKTCTCDLLLKGSHEIIARNLHTFYLEGITESEKEARQDDACLPWDQLSSFYKEKNRRQADRIPVILKEAGYRINPLQDLDAESFHFPAGGINGRDEITVMSAVEHELWCQEHFKHGWRQGSERDDEDKIHPNLTPWKNSEQKKTKKYIRDLPQILARAGFQIVKTKSHE